SFKIGARLADAALGNDDGRTVRKQSAMAPERLRQRERQPGIERRVHRGKAAVGRSSRARETRSQRGAGEKLLGGAKAGSLVESTQRRSGNQCGCAGRSGPRRSKPGDQLGVERRVGSLDGELREVILSAVHINVRVVQQGQRNGIVQTHAQFTSYNK